MEIDNGDDLSAEYLYEEVHPRQHAHQQTFAKPHGPSGKKGGRRITRPPGHRDQDDWLDDQASNGTARFYFLELPPDPLHGEPTFTFVMISLLFFYFFIFKEQLHPRFFCDFAATLSLKIKIHDIL